MRRTALIICLLLMLAPCAGPDRPLGKEAFPPLFPDPGVFLSAINHCPAKPLVQKVTGLTVPHHLLAADLMAGAFARVQGQGYRLIIILTPDHFSRSQTPFAVTRRDFETALGKLVTDRRTVDHLAANPFVSESNLFSHEHGVQAILPFIAHYFPRALVVPIAMRSTSQPAQWEALARTLAPLLGPETLVVQSTDFSHYLSHQEARRRDQETLRVLSGGDPREILSLTEPAHLDSRGCQYLQLLLQRQVFGAGVTVIANRNSQEYTGESLAKTTSYIIQVYSREPAPINEAQSFFFGGDTFCGRYVAEKLDHPERREALVKEVRNITSGKSLILNLEGVIKARCPESPGPYTLCMKDSLALPLLREFNVRAVTLANNHSRDLGEDSYKLMRRRLVQNGIACLENRQVLDLGAFYLAGFTDLDNQSEEKTARLTRQDLAGLTGLKKDKPLFALLHWGQEFAAAAGPREEALASYLEDLGVEVIIGCHSHRAGPLAATRRSCRVFSLGNFLFDQDDRRASGALLEAVFFPQGTYFLRLHPLRNLYTSLPLPSGSSP